ncbi:MULTISPECIES: hypothetical protein [unclassified Paenarthrobacter]|uniref:hypothetical protein n=1 Tax=unclassified Paenarthrobacter TaxID=2634190 RepID=UPI003814C559
MAANRRDAWYLAARRRRDNGRYGKTPDMAAKWWEPSDIAPIDGPPIHLGRTALVSSSTRPTRGLSHEAVRPSRHLRPRLGDHTLPGRHPDLQTTIGDTDGSPGTWQEPAGRSPNGAPDQAFATGVTATGPKGNASEYVTDYITATGEKKSIAFDGHLWRGRPPIQIFQEIKGNYDLVYRGLFEGFHGKAAVQRAIVKWAEETLIKTINPMRIGNLQ